VDAETGIIYINSNEMAWTGALAPNTGENSPRAIYMSQCSICHGETMTGSPPAMPSLIGVGERVTPAQMATTIKNGKGRMPGFPNLTEDQSYAVISFLLSGESKELASSAPPPASMPYRFTGYHKFLDPEGYPAVAPPWGTLSAINLNTGEYIWKIPLGEYPELASKGQKTRARKITAVRSLPQAVSCSSVQPTSTKNSTPSINPPASCFGKRPSPSPAMPLPPLTK